jgi:hypothetical protein
MVLNHLPGDPEHLRWFPGEHVDVCPEEAMSAFSYFSPKFLPMRVVWEATAPT